jgi:hypothetical protein
MSEHGDRRELPTKALPYVLAALVIAAGAFALLHTDRSASPAAATGASAAAPPAETRGAAEHAPALPPDHPPIGSSPPSPHGAAGSMGPMGVENAEPATLSWTLPSGWTQVPNPNPMRLATFRVGVGTDAPEVSVARAGGSPEANIDRWVHQFEGGGAPARSDRKVRGIDVAVVEVSGTYGGGGMMMPGAAAPSHPGWTLLGAIAQPSGGAAYFFKMLGPSAQVHDARSSFDNFLASLTPR